MRRINFLYSIFLAYFWLSGCNIINPAATQTDTAEIANQQLQSSQTETTLAPSLAPISQDTNPTLSQEVDSSNEQINEAIGLLKLMQPKMSCTANPSEFQQDDDIKSIQHDKIYFIGYGNAQDQKKDSLNLKKEARTQAMFDLAKNIQVKVESECINLINKDQDNKSVSEFRCKEKLSSDLKIDSPDFWREYFDETTCQLQTRAYILKDRVNSILRLKEANALYKKAGQLEYTLLERKQFNEQAIFLLPYINFTDLKNVLPKSHFKPIISYSKKRNCR